MSEELKNVFLAFANYGTRQMASDMDGAKFSKLCKDAKLIGGGFTSTDADLIFAKVKVKTARKITFPEFNHALELVAEKKKVTYDDICKKVMDASAVTNATQAEAVKFHDDKSLYTGVYANGGPTNVDRSKDLSGLCDRTAADVRGVKK